jgi:hypothetical protein
MCELGITTILRGFGCNVPYQLKLLYPLANISATSPSALGQAWKLDALDPPVTQLSDQCMNLLIGRFGKNHYYQADGLFTTQKAPWAAVAPETLERSLLRDKQEAVKLKLSQRNHQQVRSSAAAGGGLVPNCTFGPAHTMAYIAGCAPWPGPSPVKKRGQVNKNTDPEAVWVYQTWAGTGQRKNLGSNHTCR